MPFAFPRIYPILDRAFLPAKNRAAALETLARSLAEAGVTLLEYRNKLDSESALLADCAVLRAAMPGVKLILDDRVDLVAQVGFDGAHVDAGDVTIAEARKLLGPERIVGTYGGTESLLHGILSEPADYFSIGPIGPTTTKNTTKLPIGVEGVRKLRTAAGPAPILVAAGGVTFAQAPALIAAGASMLAVAAGIFATADPAAEFKRWVSAVA
ncbi:MAG TPA: thiamine phosphate synthase [Phycisphaerae bacterium]|nr:thiamine phosphate synthase [Phycisphaerae bacterium]